MTTVAERQEARLKGSTKAVQRWVQLGLDPDSSVDIFSVIEGERIWLLFEPLESLYGFFDRAADAAGIVIQSKHPVAVQRFTAAHEYGHFALGHQHSHDTRRELFGPAAELSLQEIEAQAFAAEFMMPLALVNRALDRLDLPREPHGITATAAYQLSLELGCSYTATLTQLRQLNKLGDRDVERLTKLEPIEIKAEVAGGVKPANSRADVWLVDDKSTRRRLQLRIGDELHIRLREIPSSGYRWVTEQRRLDGCLELVKDELEPSDLERARRVGAERQRHLWWRASKPAEGTLSLRLRRRHVAASQSAAEVVDLSLSIARPRAELDDGQGMSGRQRRPYVRQLAA
jgi:Zn-dependent peptidase ImmA (M78 family)/predicted secreted protein